MLKIYTVSDSKYFFEAWGYVKLHGCSLAPRVPGNTIVEVTKLLSCILKEIVLKTVGVEVRMNCPVLLY